MAQISRSIAWDCGGSGRNCDLAGGKENRIRFASYFSRTLHASTRKPSKVARIAVFKQRIVVCVQAIAVENLKPPLRPGSNRHPRFTCCRNIAIHNVKKKTHATFCR
jgi:hypothetical protein